MKYYTFSDKIAFKHSYFIRCTYCSGTVDEDEASEPKKDSRMQLAKFNLEMKPLYELLHNVESVRLAIYLLEPEPVEIEALLKNGESKSTKPKVPGDQQPDNWSGGKWADQKGGFKNEDQKVEISIGDENIETKKKAVSLFIQKFGGVGKEFFSWSTLFFLYCN